MKVLYFDVETTGTDPILNDIVQISGIVEVDKEVKEKFSFNVRPVNFENISKEALFVNRLTIDQLKSFDDLATIHKKLVDIFDKYVDKYNKNDKFFPAGYNCRFDLDFLKASFEKVGDQYFGSYFNYHVLDPLPILYFLEYRGKIKLDNYKLSSVCAFFNIDITAHDSASDIEATRKLIKILEKY